MSLTPKRRPRAPESSRIIDSGSVIRAVICRARPRICIVRMVFARPGSCQYPTPSRSVRFLGQRLYKNERHAGRNAALDAPARPDDAPGYFRSTRIRSIATFRQEPSP